MATGDQTAAEGGPEPGAAAAQRAGSAARAAASRVSASRAGVIPPPPWAREASPRRAKGDKPALSREAIVEAAIRIIDEEGFDAVSMRRVAQEFGTGAASLYAYVANKDELMDLIVDQMMAQTLMPPREPAEDVAGWQEQLKDMVRAGYQVLASHRDISRAMFGRIPFGPNGLRNVEAMLGLLRARGLPDHIAAYAGDLLGQYIVGTAFEDYVWQQRYPGADLEQVNAAMTEVGDYLESLPREQFPNLTALARTMVGQGPDAPLADRFELGLDIIVRGLTAFLPAGTGD
jgi:AcrR family transcriptional regulator